MSNVQRPIPNVEVRQKKKDKRMGLLLQNHRSIFSGTFAALRSVFVPMNSIGTTPRSPFHSEKFNLANSPWYIQRSADSV